MLLMPACPQAMGWALLFVASAGTGAAGLLLCVVMGVMYTLGFILASAGKLNSPSSKLSESNCVGLTGFVDLLSWENADSKNNLRDRLPGALSRSRDNAQSTLVQCQHTDHCNNDRI